MSRRKSSAKAGADTAGRPKSPRQLRVGEELRHALAQLFERGDMRDPELRGASVTVTQVDCSPDLRNAVAYVMPLGGVDRERLLAAMRRAAPYFRSQLARWWNCATRPSCSSASTIVRLRRPHQRAVTSPDVARRSRRSGGR